MNIWEKEVLDPCVLFESDTNKLRAGTLNKLVEFLTSATDTGNFLFYFLFFYLLFCNILSIFIYFNLFIIFFYYSFFIFFCYFYLF